MILKEELSFKEVTMEPETPMVMIMEITIMEMIMVTLMETIMMENIMEI